MSVMIETSVGSVVVDVYDEECPLASRNFLKLCKLKYYNNVLFYHVEKDFVAQTGDPTATGRGGCSVWGCLAESAEEAKAKRYFKNEIREDLKHDEKGVVGMLSVGPDQNNSIFYITLRSNIDFLDKRYTVFGKVVEDEDGVLDKLNALHCDDKHRPYIDTRVLHTHVLHDPFPDPKGFPKEPPASPKATRPDAEKVERRITHGDKIDENEGRTEEEIREATADQIARSKAKILRDLGDIPHEDFVPSDNILFVAKLNPVTNDEDLELIFSRFGEILSCEIVRDKKTGESLQYAFIEFETRQQCEKAYLKMDGVQIDDRRIKVDFSQSVGKMRRNDRGDARFDRRGGRSRDGNDIGGGMRLKRRDGRYGGDGRRSSPPRYRRRFVSPPRRRGDRGASPPRNRRRFVSPPATEERGRIFGESIRARFE